MKIIFRLFVLCTIFKLSVFYAQTPFHIDYKGYVMKYNENGQTLNLKQINNVIHTVVIADSLFKIKNYEGAIENYKIANSLSFFPKDQLFQMISKSYYSLGKNDSAIVYIDSAIQFGMHYWTKEMEKYDFTTNKILSFDTSAFLRERLTQNTNNFLNANEYAKFPLIRDSLKRCKFYDQLNRNGTIKTKNEWLVQKNLDSLNLVYLTYVIDSIQTWPGYKEVGRMGESASFLIAQHCEDAIFQLIFLKKMIPSYLKNNMSPAHFAFLLDRYLLNIKKEQLFGSQVVMIGGKAKVKQIAHQFNFPYANVLRKYFTLPPLDYYLNQMTQMNKK